MMETRRPFPHVHQEGTRPNSLLVWILPRFGTFAGLSRGTLAGKTRVISRAIFLDFASLRSRRIKGREDKENSGKQVFFLEFSSSSPPLPLYTPATKDFASFGFIQNFKWLLLK